MKSEQEQMCHGATLAHGLHNATCKCCSFSNLPLPRLFSCKNLHLIISPPPTSSCHFNLSFAISVYYSIPQKYVYNTSLFWLTVAHMQ